MSIALVTTSCEDETEPTHFATQDQASASSAATRALVYAMPAYFNHIDESLIDEKLAWSIRLWCHDDYP